MPVPKKDRQRMRLTALDGVLNLARLVVTASLTALVCHGEAGFVCAALLSEEGRRAAYKERHVAEKEVSTLEAALQGLRHVVLISPLGHPVKQYGNLFRDYLPEASVIASAHHTKVVVVVPVKDSAQEAVRQFGRTLLNAELYDYEFHGPAYRTCPKHLVLDVKLKPKDVIITAGAKMSYLSKRVFECFAGLAGLTAEMARLGFECRAYEKYPQAQLGTVEEGDLSRPENLNFVANAIRKKEVYHLHLSPDCSSFSPLQNLNGTTRTAERPQGDGTRPEEVLGNLTMAIACWLILLCLIHGVSFGYEHPRRSRCWWLPFFVWLLTLKGIVSSEDYDGCAWGHRPKDWHPSQGDIRVQKSSRLVTNNPYLVIVRRCCSDVVPHKHDVILGNDSTGVARSHSAAAYPVGFCQAYAVGVRRAWRATFEPPCLNITAVTFEKMKDLTYVPQVGNNNTTQRAGGTTEALAEEKPSQEEKWLETSSGWIFFHKSPRSTLFLPHQADGAKFSEGPDPDMLKDTRMTEVVFADGTKQVIKDNWREVGGKTLKRLWTGKSIFIKLGAVAAPAAVAAAAPEVPVHVDGQPVAAGSAAALSADLHSMRKELIAAQRSDPRLKEIIGVLERKPLGSFLAAPRVEGKRAQARSDNYKLAADGLLLLKTDDSVSELPVVPDVLYLGESRSADAPKRMTWKHLLLGAVHNASAHLSAKQMQEELSKVVAWFPSDKLRHDCELWIERCKHCVAVHRAPRAQAELRPILEHRPMFRIQIDLMEISPEGINGEKYILTCICLCTRYVWFRVLRTRDQTEIAESLLDIVLDMGIVPAIIQSDNEFASAALEEFCYLLGARQLFSTALRPQSQGVVERCHRDVRSGLAVMVEAFARACPRTWPKFVRWLEHKLRHKILAPGMSPYQVVHGFAGSTSLQTALQQIEKIPQTLITQEWLDVIVAESKRLSTELHQHFLEAAMASQARQAEEVPRPKLRVGDLVLVQKPFYEKGTGMILPKCDGPYEIMKMPDTHVAILADPVSHIPFQHGQAIATSRLVSFKFPKEWLQEGWDELFEEAQKLELKVGSFVAVEKLVAGKSRIHIGRITKVFTVGDQVEVSLYAVPTGERYGPWERRPWEPLDQTEVVGNADCLCEVELVNKALTRHSIELLSSIGVIMTTPQADKTLPGRRI